MNENIVELQTENGITLQCEIYEIFSFEEQVYGILCPVKEEYNEIIFMKVLEEDDNCYFSGIEDEEEFKKVCKYFQSTSDRELYKSLITEEYKEYPFETRDLGEGMSVINETMRGWWKPRYLLNHNTKCAYEFMDCNQNLLVTEDDIDWESLKALPRDAQEQAKRLSFYPSFIRAFKNGVAVVSWQLNPDGRCYMDDDGFGMDDDEEIEIYGLIDQEAQVIIKLRNIQNFNELGEMRKMAEDIVKNNR